MEGKVDMEPCTVDHIRDPVSGSYREKENEFFQGYADYNALCVPIKNKYVVYQSNSGITPKKTYIQIDKCTERPDCKSEAEIEAFISRIELFISRYEYDFDLNIYNSEPLKRHDKIFTWQFLDPSVQTQIISQVQQIIINTDDRWFRFISEFSKFEYFKIST